MTVNPLDEPIGDNIHEWVFKRLPLTSDQQLKALSDLKNPNDLPDDTEAKSMYTRFEKCLCNGAKTCTFCYVQSQLENEKNIKELEAQMNKHNQDIQNLLTGLKARELNPPQRYRAQKEFEFHKGEIVKQLNNTRKKYNEALHARLISHWEPVKPFLPAFQASDVKTPPPDTNKRSCEEDPDPALTFKHIKASATAVDDDDYVSILFHDTDDDEDQKTTTSEGEEPRMVRCYSAMPYSHPHSASPTLKKNETKTPQPLPPTQDSNPMSTSED